MWVWLNKILCFIFGHREKEVHIARVHGDIVEKHCACKRCGEPWVEVMYKKDYYEKYSKPTNGDW